MGRHDLLATHSPVDVIAGIIDYWKQVLIGSDFTMGCPILAAAQAGPAEPAVQAALRAGALGADIRHYPAGCGMDCAFGQTGSSSSHSSSCRTAEREP